MVIKFFWEKRGKSYWPHCSSDSSDESGEQFLSELLEDDGGVRVERSIGWVDEGVRILESIVAGRVPHAEWGREHWGTNIGADHVEIYFLLQEDYSASIETAVFHRALVAWQEFLRNGPHGVAGSLNELVLDL